MSPMDDRDGKIWMDGKLTDWRNAKIHVLTHSLHYGMSVFEGVRAYKTDKGTVIFRLVEHTKRLLNSAKIFQMNVPYDMDTLMEAQKQVIRDIRLETGYIRPIIWIGSEALGISVYTVQEHISTSLRVLRTYLEKYSMAGADLILLLICLHA